MVNLLGSLPKIVEHKKKRLGRGLGSGKGSKSGRGTTRHQKARESIPLHFEGGQGRIVKKYPLLRGKGKNKSFKTDWAIVSLDQLNKLKDGMSVSLLSLIKEKIVADKVAQVKILANGKLEKKLIVSLPVSAGAKRAIEAAGGQVVAPTSKKYERNQRKD